MGKAIDIDPNEKAERVVNELSEEFRNGHDRAVAILGGAYLEALVESLLRSFLKASPTTTRLLEPSGAMGAHGSRVALALSLGLITDSVKCDLDVIARIRNAFAHDFEIESFNHDRVRDLCRNLKQPELHEDLAKRTAHNEAELRVLVASVREEAATPRGRFQMSIRILIVNLFRRIRFLAPMQYNWFIHDPDSSDGPKQN